jgi:hypothetical protein
MNLYVIRYGDLYLRKIGRSNDWTADTNDAKKFYTLDDAKAAIDRVKDKVPADTVIEEFTMTPSRSFTRDGVERAAGKGKRDKAGE